jgi:hypothetical protein
MIVRLCLIPCLFASMSIFYDCNTIDEESTEVTDRPPKKNAAFKTSAQERGDKFNW